MSSDFAATMPYAIRRAEEARRPSPAEVLQDEAPMFPATPIYARQRKRSGLAGVSPAALIGAGVVLAAAAAGVFALTWDRGPEPVQVASTPIDQPPIPMQPEPPAVNDPAVMAEAAQTPVEPAAPAADAQPPIERAATPAPAPAKPQRLARVRAAPAAPSASDTAEDASALLPAGPMPYVPDGTPTQPMTPSASAATPPPVVAPPVAEPPIVAPQTPIDAAPAQASDAPTP